MFKNLLLLPDIPIFSMTTISLSVVFAVNRKVV